MMTASTCEDWHLPRWRDRIGSMIWFENFARTEQNQEKVAQVASSSLFCSTNGDASCPLDELCCITPLQSTVEPFDRNGSRRKLIQKGTMFLWSCVHEPTTVQYWLLSTPSSKLATLNLQAMVAAKFKCSCKFHQTGTVSPAPLLDNSPA